MAGPKELGRYLGPQRAQLLKAKPMEIVQMWKSLIPPVDEAVFSGKLGQFLASNMKKALLHGYEG